MFLLTNCRAGAALGGRLRIAQRLAADHEEQVDRDPTRRAHPPESGRGQRAHVLENERAVVSMDQEDRDPSKPIEGRQTGERSAAGLRHGTQRGRRGVEARTQGGVETIVLRAWGQFATVRQFDRQRREQQLPVGYAPLDLVYVSTATQRRAIIRRRALPECRRIMLGGRRKYDR